MLELCRATNDVWHCDQIQPLAGDAQQKKGHPHRVAMACIFPNLGENDFQLMEGYGSTAR